MRARTLKCFVLRNTNVPSFHHVSALLSVLITIILALVELSTYQSLGSHCPTHAGKGGFRSWGLLIFFQDSRAWNKVTTENQIYPEQFNIVQPNPFGKVAWPPLTRRPGPAVISKRVFWMINKGFINKVWAETERERAMLHQSVWRNILIAKWRPERKIIYPNPQIKVLK